MKVNDQYNSKELYFVDKPNESTREALKALHFRWNPKKLCWYGFATDEQLAEIIGCDPVLEIPEQTFVDGGGLYDGWRGGNNRKWRSDKELKAFLLDDFKKAGIKATIRFNRAGYLTSITCTMTIKEGEILSFEQWSEGKCWHDLYSASSWIYYTDEDGKLRDIFGEKFLSLPDDERNELEPNIIKTYYNKLYNDMQSSHVYFGSKFELLNEDAKKRFNILQEIVASYNHDCSNSMIDYFDRDIYDSYCVKIA